MTKGLEDALNLPPLEDIIPEADRKPEKKERDVSGDTLDAQMLTYGLELAQNALDYIEGADHAQKMDELYEESLKHARDIMDLGFNVDHARAARMFEVASSFFKNALDSANSKRDAQLKAMKLALEHQKMQAKKDGDDTKTLDNNSVVIEDRNELIRRLRDEQKDK